MAENSPTGRQERASSAGTASANSLKSISQDGVEDGQGTTWSDIAVAIYERGEVPSPCETATCRELLPGRPDKAMLGRQAHHRMNSRARHTGNRARLPLDVQCTGPPAGAQRQHVLARAANRRIMGPIIPDQATHDRGDENSSWLAFGEPDYSLAGPTSARQQFNGACVRGS